MFIHQIRQYGQKGVVVALFVRSKFNVKMMYTMRVLNN